MAKATKPKEKLSCGIIMPISELDGCSEQHWSDVLEILTEAIEGADFKADLVSNTDEVSIIHKTIIQNIYQNPIVVCDVSGKNPNVMFELGMRLAFDKPCIIIKDDKTSYSFDTSPIEHLEYPRDLRFTKIVSFKNKLTEKIKRTYEKSQNDSNYTTFLKNFGEFKIAKIESKEVSGEEFIIEEIKGMRLAIQRLERNDISKDRSFQFHPHDADIDICLSLYVNDQTEIDKVFSEVNKLDGVESTRLNYQGKNHSHLYVNLSRSSEVLTMEGKITDVIKSLTEKEKLKKEINKILPRSSKNIIQGKMRKKTKQFTPNNGASN